MASEKQEPEKRYPYRGQSKRLKGYDYTQPGPYFVTINARTHDPIFEHPQLRAMLHETWQALPQQFPGVKLDAFVSMPNHIHGILWLPGQGQPAPTLSRVMGAYKSLTTVAWIRACKTIGIQGVGTFWLDDFYDRIIPNTAALQRIRHSIRQNPAALATREG
jgi:putative transposase